ncbi:MAG: glycosyltransferase [Promethearchaeota archaeon]
MEEKKKLWILTFEYGPAKVGGLGEVPTNQVKQLQDDLDITLFMPAHGLVSDSPANYSIEPLDITLAVDINLVAVKTMDGHGPQLPDSCSCEVALYKLKKKGISANIILLSGNDDISQKILNDPVVYSKTCLKAKMLFFSQAIKAYTKYILDHDEDNLPDVVHVHDYHPMPGFIAARQLILENQRDVALIYTAHLLTGPKVNMEYLTDCGVMDRNLPVYIRNRKKSFPVKKLLEMGGYRLEYVSAVMADLVTSVSRAYLEKHVVPSCGGGLLTGKVDFIYNGCDWDYGDTIKEIKASIGNKCNVKFREKDFNDINRIQLRNYLMTRLLEEIPDTEPIVNDNTLKQEVSGLDGIGPYLKSGRVMNFPRPGKLFLITGRASKQKGLKGIFATIPKILAVHPDSCFLFLLLPTQGEKDLISEYMELALDKNIRDNVRVIMGKTPSIFKLAHLVADGYLANSKWEPFGIMVLEAHSLKLPVIGAQVGGIQETVINIAEDPEHGTGILFSNEKSTNIVKALQDYINLIDISEFLMDDSIAEPDEKIIILNSIISRINDPNLRKIVKNEPTIYLRMRENALKRVNNTFRWSIVAQKELKLIEKAISHNKLH